MNRVDEGGIIWTLRVHFIYLNTIPVTGRDRKRSLRIKRSLKMDISMPACPKKDFIHLPTVLPETGKCGATRPMKSKLLF